MLYASSRLLIEDFTVSTNAASDASHTYYTSSTSAGLNDSSSSNFLNCATSNGACNSAPLLVSESFGDRAVALGGFNDTANGGTFSGTICEATPSPTLKHPTAIKFISEAGLGGSGIAAGSSSFTSETTMEGMVFTPAEGEITITFNAKPNLYVYVDTPGWEIASARVSVGVTINILSVDAGVEVSWTPGPVSICNNTHNTIVCDAVAPSSPVRTLNRTLQMPVAPAGTPVVARAYNDDRPQYFGLFGASPDSGMQQYQLNLTGLYSGSYVIGVSVFTNLLMEHVAPLADYVVTPTLTATGFPSKVSTAPFLIGSNFATFFGTDTHHSSDWQVLSLGGIVLWESLANQIEKTSINVGPGILSAGTPYQFRVRYRSTGGMVSGWGSFQATPITPEFWMPSKHLYEIP